MHENVQWAKCLTHCTFTCTRQTLGLGGGGGGWHDGGGRRWIPLRSPLTVRYKSNIEGACKAVLLSLSTFQAISTEAEGAETILFPITAIPLQCSKSPTKPSLNKLVFKRQMSRPCINALTSALAQVFTYAMTAVSSFLFPDHQTMGAWLDFPPCFRGCF